MTISIGKVVSRHFAERRRFNSSLHVLSHAGTNVDMQRFFVKRKFILRLGNCSLYRPAYIVYLILLNGYFSCDYFRMISV